MKVSCTILFRLVGRQNPVKKLLKFLTVRQYGSKFSQCFASDFAYL